MITIEPTSDKAYIKSVIMTPGVLEGMKDDSFPDNYREVVANNIDHADGFFIKVLVDGVGAGWFWFRPFADMFEAHVTLLDNCRGRKALIAAKKAIRWVFKNTGAKAITCYVFSDRPAVRWFCNAIGFTEKHKSLYSTTRNGEPIDSYYLEIQRTT